MLSHRAFRSLSALLVLALLFAPWASEASPTAPRAEAAANESIVNHFLGWLVVLLGDVGLTWDPNGRSDSGSTELPSGTERLDPGCTADPSGSGCRERLDSACTWDPDGGGCRNNS